MPELDIVGLGQMHARVHEAARAGKTAVTVPTRDLDQLLEDRRTMQGELDRLRVLVREAKVAEAAVH
jgi:hypothetical protein